MMTNLNASKPSLNNLKNPNESYRYESNSTKYAVSTEALEPLIKELTEKRENKEV